MKQKELKTVTLTVEELAALLRTEREKAYLEGLSAGRREVQPILVYPSPQSPPVSIPQWWGSAALPERPLPTIT